MFGTRKAPLYPTRAFTAPELLAARQSKFTTEHLTHLQEHGYCIIEDILSAETCAKVKTDFYDYLISMGTGLTIEQLKTGQVKTLQLPYNLHGIIQYPRAVGPEVMRVRFDKYVNQVFAALWDVKCEDLITSEDRACYMPRVPDIKYRAGTGIYKPWLHLDQPSIMSGLQCVQGLVTINNVSEQGGTLVVIPGSHKHHSTIAKAAEDASGDKAKSSSANRFVRIPETLVDKLKEEHQLEPKAIRPLKAGSMVLWDSRTVHCNTQTQSEERIVVYTCQVPRAWVKEAPRNQMKHRQEAFLGARNTSHWPHHVKLFPTKPHIYDKLREFPVKLIDEPLIAARHFDALEKLPGFEDDFEERGRLCRLAGFTSHMQYKLLKGSTKSKRKIDQVEEAEEKPKKKTKVES